MEQFLRYILLSTACISLFYLTYLLFVVKEHRLNYQRNFLLISVALSLTIPLSQFKIHLNLKPTVPVYQEIAGHDYTKETEFIEMLDFTEAETANNQTIPIKTYLIALYVLGLSFFVLRFLLHFFRIFNLFKRSKRITVWGIPVLCNDNMQTTFSFFNLIFVPNDLSLNAENKEIILHERIHASQYHSIDIILVELLAAVMWFNPLIWLMRNSIRLVHEYLADEGVLNAGIDKLTYQAILVNQAAEERLVCISSNFNPVFWQGRQSLIKKRIIMMTNNKLNQRLKAGFFALVPIASLLFVGVACFNGSKEIQIISPTEPNKENVLYLNIENPLIIAVSGYKFSELNVSVDNGTISGGNGSYIIKPNKEGVINVAVMRKNKVIQNKEFITAHIPNPIAKVMGKSGGNISKALLSNAPNVYAVIENFEFEIRFQVTQFSVKVIEGEHTNEYFSENDNFTGEQQYAILSAKRESHVIFDNIKAKAPDGTIRDLEPMEFKIH